MERQREEIRLEEQFVIGIDGGGTNTTVIVSGMDGTVIGKYQLGALNINGQTYDSTEYTLTAIIRELETLQLSIKKCKGICIGAAGISNEDTQILFTLILRKLGMEGVIKLVGDHEAALAGALEGRTGVILIAGTGSICYGVNESRVAYRAGGYGHMIDDAGSGYAIGLDILKAVVRQSDGRQEQTVLTEKLFRNLQVDTIGDLITWLYQPNRSKKEIAALAPLLEEGLAVKDKVSIAILEHSVKELTELAKAVLVHFKESTSLVMSGSVLLKNKEIYQLVCKHIKKEYPELDIIKMRGNAAEGAVKIILQELASYEYSSQ